MSHSRVTVSNSAQGSRGGERPVSWIESLEPMNCLELSVLLGRCSGQARRQPHSMSCEDSLQPSKLLKVV